MNTNLKLSNRPEHTVQKLFEQQVIQNPDSVALVYKDQQLTYKELNEKVNQLAFYLQKRNIGPESMVGVYIERSLEMIVSILGIIKAGGAYVPLDPAYPTKRLEYILKDANIQVLLTQNHPTQWIPKEIDCINIKEHEMNISREKNINPTIEVKPDNLAYVIYTSGSTGKPKGVLIEQKSLCNFIISSINLTKMNSDSRNIQFASLSFDASVFEIFTSLVSGGTLYVCSQHDIMPVEPLTQFLQKNKITHALLPPTVLNLLDESVFKDLQVVISAGSACSEQVAKRWMQNHLFINAYGPTETTVYTVAGIYKGDGAPPIGRSIPNVEVYVLNEAKKLVPIGTVGELYIGGIALARGYLNQPELTKASFIPHPFKNSSNDRLYRTGDLVKYLPDGNIEYIGRADKQVKIRGFRIELGEIETILGNHPDIKEVTVVAQEDSFGDNILVAYIVGEGDTQEWRKHVGVHLPKYMVPAHFIKIESLPLTVNGKVDKDALPAWASIIQTNEGYIAPRNRVEQKMVEIWSEVLGIDSSAIGINDNFFELGGHSLLATKITSRLGVDFSILVQIRDIFEYPTIKHFSKRLTFLLGKTGEIDVFTPLQSVKREQYEPLSFAQQRLWIMDKIVTNSALYNVPIAWRLKGKWNIEMLKKGYNAIIHRHEILRTVFHEVDGKPVQIVQQDITVPLSVIDLRYLSPEDKTSKIENISKIEAKKPFDLSQGPLLRTHLIIMDNKELVLLCTIHHIIFDRWSLDTFINEWMSFYQAFLENETEKLPPLPVQYIDFTKWQKSWLTEDIIQKQIAYWGKELRGLLPILELPLDYPRPIIQSYNGDTYQIVIPNKLLEKIKVFNSKEGVTLFATLLASYQGFLSRYTNQKDILVGSPIANRNYPGVEDLIGFFANTVVYRADCSNNITFKELVQQIKKKMLDAQENQDVPFEKVIEAIQPERDMSYSPLFQTMFVFHNQLKELPKLLDHSVEKIPRHMNGAKFDITIAMEEIPTGLQVDFEYNTDLFKVSTIKRMAQSFEIWLDEILQFPEEPIENLRILTKNEEKQLLHEWTNIEGNYQKDVVIQELFEQQVIQNPDSVALVYKDQQLTYKELNEKVNQLAFYLQKRNIGPESMVGVYIERSLEMIVSILGIIKAGGAYVPLDPAYPTKRLEYILKDANIQVLLTQSHLTQWIPKEIDCIDIKEHEMNISREKNINPTIEVKPDNLAYVIYTSGSTGNPKGVLYEQKGLCNFINASINFTKLNTGSKVVQFSSIAFDVSLYDIFATLVSGGTLYVCGQQDIMPVEPLTQFLLEKKITHAFLPPTVLNLLDESKFEELQTVISAGSVCSEQVAKRWVKNHLFINAYGPTEASVATIDIYSGKGTPPIGRSIPNVEVYVLNEAKKLVPIGTVGELYIGGIALARGYLNQPELTKASFIPHPFKNSSNDRLYRTGDLVKYLPDGNIEYIGRADKQVKIRGFRIELGEIETILGNHPDIKEVTVVAQEDSFGDNILVAYIVGEGDTQEWRKHVGVHLPNYMVPAHFIKIESLPLTVNGKVDKDALPAWASIIQTNEGYIAPRNRVEQKMVEIWSEVLGIDSSVIGINDNFFDLGGHSLKIMSTLVKTFSEGWNVTIKDYFELKTINNIAKKIQYGYKVNSHSDTLDIKLTTPPKKLKKTKRHEFSNNSKILLTGATGFLGIHLLEQLLDTTECKIYCLVRGENKQEANNRLLHMLKFYFKNKFVSYQSLVNQRIFIVQGDLAKQNMGLENELYKELHQQISTVIHAAALTKHFGEYSEFERANVQAVKELLAFVGDTKDLHHISTTGVAGQFVLNETETIFKESDFYVKQNYKDNVYVKSKFLAEYEIFKAILTGTDATIYRVGNLTNRYIDGQHQYNFTENAFMSKLKFILQYGIVTDVLLSSEVEFTPVDYCSKIITGFVTSNEIHENSKNCVNHIYNHLTLNLNVLVKLLNSMGYPIKVISETEYQQFILELSKDKKKQEDIQNLMTFEEPKDNCYKPINLDSTETQKTLKLLGIQWPIINSEYIQQIINYMTSVTGSNSVAKLFKQSYTLKN
ncbi:amino acid adenylation domain-containing protein [Bacillus sp. FSL L8-0287]